MINYLIIGSTVAVVSGIIIYIIISKEMRKHVGNDEFSLSFERFCVNIIWGLCIFLVPLLIAYGLYKFDNAFILSSYTPLISCVLWLLAFSIINRILNHMTINNFTDEKLSVDYKTALAYLGMLISCLIYELYAIKTGISGKLDNVAIGASISIMVLILGFCVPLDLLFTNTSIRQRKRIIFKNLKIVDVCLNDKVNTGSVIIYMIYAIFAICCVFLEDELIKGAFSVFLGIHFGFFIAIIVVAVIKWKNYDAIIDCIDTKKKIFESTEFLKFKDSIKKRYCIKKFDLLTSVMIFNWFIEKNNHDKDFYRDSYYTGFNGLYKDYIYLQYYIENKDFVLLNNFETYKTKDEQKEIINTRFLTIDYIVSPWFLIKKYIDVFLSSKKDNVDDCDANNSLDNWYSELIKQYIKMTKKERKKLITKEIKEYIRKSYKKVGCWVIPYVYTKNNQKASSLSFFKKEYNYIDIILTYIYRWFESGKKDNSYIYELCSNQQKAEELLGFLKPFSEWSIFVRQNHLEVFCKRKCIFGNKYKQPIKIMENYDFIYSANKDYKDDWLEMFKSIACKFDKRRFYMDKDYGDKL